MKMLIRGGSIAAGRGVHTSYVDIIRQEIEKRGHSLINVSREGENSFDCVWTFADDIGPYKPDMLILHYGMDDAFFPVYRSEFKENLVQTIRLARKLFDPIVLLLTSHSFQNQYDMNAVNIYYRVIREITIDLSCDMVPVHTYWAGFLFDNNADESFFLQSDDRLPNEKGHEIFAQVIHNKLLHYL